MSFTDQPDPQGDPGEGVDESPSPWNTPGFIAATALVLLLVVAGGFAVIRGLTNDDDPTTGGTDESTSANPGPDTETDTPPEDPDASVCGLEGFKKSGTVATTPDVTWELVGSIAAPTSSTAGPGVTEESGLRYCYAHTPEGAVLAATNSYTWNEVYRTDYNLVIEHNMASGPGRDRAKQVLDAASPAELERITSYTAQIRGFRVDAYDPTAAVVTVVIAVDRGDGTIALASGPIELTWEEGDWRVRLTPDGKIGGETNVLPNLEGFVPLRGA